MNSKKDELNAAKEKLAKLIDDLDVIELQFDKAVEHSANYLGNDQRIEEVRDEKARSVYESMNRVKDEIKNQTQLIEKLVDGY